MSEAPQSEAAPPVRRPPYSFETRLLIGLGAIVCVGLVTLSLVRMHEELVLFDLNSGQMRLDRRILGFQYDSEPLGSNLEWMQMLAVRSALPHWVPVFERHDCSLLRQPLLRRRIGQVYVDACTYAQILHGHDRASLGEALRRIATADSEGIWAVRQELRATYEQRRPQEQRP